MIVNLILSHPAILFAVVAALALAILARVQRSTAAARAKAKPGSSEDQWLAFLQVLEAEAERAVGIFKSEIAPLIADGKWTPDRRKAVQQKAIAIAVNSARTLAPGALDLAGVKNDELHAAALDLVEAALAKAEGR